jgi:hypothetical protein
MEKPVYMKLFPDPLPQVAPSLRASDMTATVVVPFFTKESLADLIAEIARDNKMTLKNGKPSRKQLKIINMELDRRLARPCVMELG